MKSITIKKLYQMHSWVGIVTGILLFIVAFTGAFAVFFKTLFEYLGELKRDSCDLSCTGTRC